MSKKLKKCEKLKKINKNVVVVVVVPNVPACTGTRTCVSTCARGAGVQGTLWTDIRGRFESTSAYQNIPTYGYHVLQRSTGPDETVILREICRSPLPPSATASLHQSVP